MGEQEEGPWGRGRGGQEAGAAPPSLSLSLSPAVQGDAGSPVMHRLRQCSAWWLWERSRVSVALRAGPMSPFWGSGAFPIRTSLPLDYGFCTIFAQDLVMLQGCRDLWQEAPPASPIWRHLEIARGTWVAEFAAGTERVKAALQWDFFFLKPFPSCPETVYFLGILWDSGRCLFFKAFPVSKFIFGLGRVWRGGGCWGGVRRPKQGDLSFWLLVLNCSRWQLWEQWLWGQPAVGAGSHVCQPPAALALGTQDPPWHRGVRANRRA